MCGWSGAGNLGDELLTEVVISRLRAVGLDPVIRSAAPGVTEARHPRVDVVGRGLASLRAALQVDGVVLGPGGIVQDHTSIWSLPAHVVPALVVRARRRRVVGIGLGADPLRRRLSRWLLRAALGGGPIVVRDERSQAAMAAAGLDAEIDLDLAWELPASEADERVGLTVALGPVAGVGAWRPGRRRLVPDDPAPVVEAIERLHERVGGPLRLVGFRGERDERYAEVLAGHLPAASVVDGAAGVDAVRGSELVVTSRYHAAVVALSSGVPVLADVRQGKLAALAATPDLAPAIVGFSTWNDVGETVPTCDAPVRRTGSAHTDDALDWVAAGSRSGRR